MSGHGNYAFFRHDKCEFFPCHSVADDAKFNCLFCYCPLYALGDKCGGNFEYIAGGIKDCSHCLIPHSEGGYDYIVGKYPQIAELAKREDA
ncbi:MAG: cysteine-rich small domain-containing protein [Clostridia bacterium]|nr:cysteine-rich small domain-containing protein [Clostridia bacterium]